MFYATTLLLLVWCAVASSHPSLGRHKNRLNQVLLDEAKKWQQKAMDVAQEELTHWTPDIDNSECSFGMCGGIPNYPNEAVKTLLTTNPGIATLLRPATQIEVERSEDDVLTRSGAYEERYMCDSEVHVSMPQYWRDTNNETRTIINIPNTFTQTVTSYRCDHRLNGSQCLCKEKFGADGECEQKYIIQELVIVNSDGTGIERGRFEVPSACVCKVQVRRHHGTN